MNPQITFPNNSLTSTHSSSSPLHSRDFWWRHSRLREHSKRLRRPGKSIFNDINTLGGLHMIYKNHELLESIHKTNRRNATLTTFSHFTKFMARNSNIPVRWTGRRDRPRPSPCTEWRERHRRTAGTSFNTFIYLLLIVWVSQDGLSKPTISTYEISVQPESTFAGFFCFQRLSDDEGVANATCVVYDQCYI